MYYRENSGTRNRIEHLLPSQQSSLQFGFTKGTSILLSALVINESGSLIWPDHLTLDDRLKYQASMRLHIFPLIPL
jgi:hypothetical protein